MQLVIVTATNYETFALHLFPPPSIKSLIHHSIWKFAGFSIKLVFKVNDRKQAVCAIGKSGTQQWFIHLGTNKWCFNWLTAFIVFKHVWQFSWIYIEILEGRLRWTKNPNQDKFKSATYSYHSAQKSQLSPNDFWLAIHFWSRRGWALMCPSLEILRLISFKAAASVTDRIRRAVADTAELGLLVRYLLH